MIYPPELEAILERPNTTDERKYSRLDVIDAYNLMKQQADGMQLERNIMQEMAMKAREAGRREGLYVASDLLRNNGVLLPIIVGETKQDRIVRFALAMADKIEALIDSPKAEVERKESE